MSDFLKYGDASGVLGRWARAGDQTLTGPQPPSPTPYDLITIIGDADALVSHARGGNDTIQNVFFGNSTVLIGDARTMSGHARGGNDTIQNNTGFNNTILGDAEKMSEHARGGNDVVAASAPSGSRLAAASDVFGDARILCGHAKGGDDILLGALGFESTARLYGDGLELRGHAKGGDDRLVSRGFDKDEMWGDAATVGKHAKTGDDIFVFGIANGSDVIHDFEPGKDLIDLTAFAAVGIDSFDDLASRISVKDGDSRIDLSTRAIPAMQCWLPMSAC
jgi:NDP-sugar pyrophosphorylase family protein